MRLSYLVWESYQHKRVAGPYMKMILIKLKRWLAVAIDARWHLQLHVFIPDVFLLKIHSMIASMLGEQNR